MERNGLKLLMFDDVGCKETKFLYDIALYGTF